MPRTTVESLPFVSVFELKSGGNLEHDCMVELTWSESGEQRRVVVSLVLSDQDPHAMLSYDEYGRYWSYRVPMESVPCYFGGKRWYFRCPLAANGVHCGARVAILYKNGEVFGCRTCQNLSYPLQNVTHTGSRSDFYRVMQAMRWGGKIKKLRTKYWRGALTKRQSNRVSKYNRYIGHNSHTDI